ncbi:hypothetical protein JB92DRAFT_2145621 [Gautieria morchelliformis]|nr:hypothetical protein JB92DRAFT_2145621 [Gautieria morchelliformis]
MTPAASTGTTAPISHDCCLVSALSSFFDAWRQRCVWTKYRMPTAIRIVNDTIVPGARSSFEIGLTSREAQVRTAFFILAVGAPLVAAVFALCTTRRWWTSANLWSLPRLCALWFISVAAFATIVFIQPGQATRSTFVLAIIHGMVEISIMYGS